MGRNGLGDPLGTRYGAVGNMLSEVLTGPWAQSLIVSAQPVDFSLEAFDDDRTLVDVAAKTGIFQDR
jgi:hypothetical protein